ncbi:hypothetical protein EVG20_g9264 [Dentipellis fragilis]|uniref:Uncharacterized protein n=1 Tax=Dentipellis fragilis TaxID=205917 RepID=A0A4Y9Y1J3_9AGAM|nr:hypothetical protein EVG20_g9264 [Dentipellis fragilis]
MTTAQQATSMETYTGTMTFRFCALAGLTQRIQHLGVAILLRGEDEEIAHALGVAPLVVVPGDELDEVGVERDAGGRVEDGRVRVADEVGGDDRVLGVLDDALVRARRSASLNAFLISSYDAPFSRRTTRSTTETSLVGTRKERPLYAALGHAWFGRRTESDVRELAVEAGDDLADALAAPVDEGMMLPLTPRPPRQSLCEGRRRSSGWQW